MRKIFNIFVFFVLILSLIVSCKNNVEPKEDPFTEETDYLLLLYLSGDANNGDNFFPTLQQAEDALYKIEKDSSYASVKVLALWDGPSNDNASVHSSSLTRLLELGSGYHDFGDGTDEGHYGRFSKLDWSLSNNTKDLSSSVNWLFSNGRQEVNMGSEKILTNFLNYAINNYKAKHVILFFGDHGAGPCPEEEYNAKSFMHDTDINNDRESSFLTTSKLRNAVENSYGFGKIDLIIEDLCIQASIDEAYGLQGCANYLIASENVTCGNSLGSYNLILQLKKNANIKDIAKSQITYYKNKWQNLEDMFTLTFSLIDLSKADSFSIIRDNVSMLAQKIYSLGEATYLDIVKTLKSTATDYGFKLSLTYLDARDLGFMAYMLGKNYPCLSSNTNLICDALKDIIVRSYVKGNGFDWELADGQVYGLTIGVSKTYDMEKPFGEWTRFGKLTSWSDLIIDKKVL